MARILIQNFESVNSIPFAGRAVTISFYARAGANFSAASAALQYNVATGTGTDQNLLTGFTGRANPILANATLTTTWQRFTATATLAATATQIAVAFDATWVGTAGANDYYEVTGVQLELGSYATTFSRVGGTIQGELAACQRYYYRQTGPQTLSMLSNAGWGSNSAQYVYSIFNTPVSMRSAPTSLDWANVTFGDGSNWFVPTTMVITTNYAGNNLNLLEIYYAAGGLVQFRPYWIRCNNNTSAYLGVSAEL